MNCTTTHDLGLGKLPNGDEIWLASMWIAERLKRGLVSPMDAAIDLVKATKFARDAVQGKDGEP